VLVAAVAVLVTGCESTQDKSARLAKSATKSAHEKGLVITERNAAQAEEAMRSHLNGVQQQLIEHAFPRAPVAE